MKQSQDSEKSKGVLVFAHNTDKIDYVEIAARTAKIMKKTLNLPIAIVTDSKLSSEYENIFDYIIIENDKFVNSRADSLDFGTQWRNGSRLNAYEATPFDETLLIDSDVIVVDKKIIDLFECTLDYKLLSNNRFIKQPLPDRMSPYSIDSLWATIVIFKKTLKTRYLFDLIYRIRENFQYYYRLYNINSSNFRNDFAFTIAHNIINGYKIESDNIIPWQLLATDFKISSIELNDKFFVIRGMDKAYVIPKCDMHILDKSYLLSDDFLKLVNIL